MLARIRRIHRQALCNPAIDSSATRLIAIPALPTHLPSTNALMFLHHPRNQFANNPGTCVDAAMASMHAVGFRLRGIEDDLPRPSPPTPRTRRLCTASAEQYRAPFFPNCRIDTESAAISAASRQWAVPRRIRTTQPQFSASAR